MCWCSDTCTTLQKNKNGFPTYHPTKNTFQIPSNPYAEVIYLYTYGRQNPVVAHAIHVLYMVGKIQFRVTCLRYWILSTCVGTKKPHVVGMWLELFPIWKYQDSSLVTRAVAMSK